MDLGVARREDHLVVLDRRIPHLDIVGDRIFKQRDILIYDSQRSPENSFIDLPDRLSVKEDLTAPGLMQTRQELGERGFAAAGSADKGNALSGLKRHAEILDQGLSQRRVSERDVPHLHLAGKLGVGYVLRSGVRLILRKRIDTVFHNVLDPFHLCPQLLDCLSGRDQCIGRGKKSLHIDAELRDHTGCELPLHR